MALSGTVKKYLFATLNILEILGICLVLATALVFQFFFHEIPCPLCLLQRVGFISICVVLLFNIRFRFHPAHYSLALVGALFTAFVSLRQVALHIVPGTGSYGPSLLGLHFYTWSLILSMGIIIYTIILLSFGVQYEGSYLQTKLWKFIRHSLFAFVTAVILINAISTFLECGLKTCPENPAIHFKL